MEEEERWKIKSKKEKISTLVTFWAPLLLFTSLKPEEKIYFAKKKFSPFPICLWNVKKYGDLGWSKNLQTTSETKGQLGRRKNLDRNKEWHKTTYLGWQSWTISSRYITGEMFLGWLPSSYVLLEAWREHRNLQKSCSEVGTENAWAFKSGITAIAFVDRLFFVILYPFSYRLHFIFLFKS